MRETVVLAVAALMYTSSAFAADVSPRPAEEPVALADCGAHCMVDGAAPVQATREAGACGGAHCAAEGAWAPKITCDDDHPCLDP